MTHYCNHSVEIQDTADTTAVIVGSITQTSTPIDNDIQQSSTAGTFYPEHVSVASVNPRNTLTTMDIKKALTALGVSGANITEAVGKVGWAIYQAKYENGGLQAGAVHRRLRFPYCFAINRSISVSHRQDASIDMEAMAIWDKTNDPVVIESSVSLPTLPASPGRWTIGKATIGGILIPCLTDVNIDFGVNPSMFGCDSDIHETHLNLDTIQPTITLTSLDVTTFADAKVALEGLCAQHVDSVLYLRKRNDCTAGFVADGTAEHIKFTADGVLNVTEAHSATANQRASINMTLTCKFDGTNSPIVPTVDSAIT